MSTGLTPLGLFIYVVACIVVVIALFILLAYGDDDQ